MSQELREVTGIVENVKEESNAIRLKDFGWIGNRFKEKITCKVGDKVKVFYYEKGNFKNHETIEILESAPEPEKPEPTKEEIPSSMLLSYSKDILVALVNSVEIKLDQLEKGMEEAVKTVKFGIGKLRSKHAK